MPGEEEGCFHLSVKGYDYQTNTEHQQCGQDPMNQNEDSSTER